MAVRHDLRRIPEDKEREERSLRTSRGATGGPQGCELGDRGAQSRSALFAGIPAAADLAPAVVDDSATVPG